MIEYFKNLIKLFKSTKKENLDTIIDDLENIKSNINSIFDEVMNDKEFSQYRLDLLNRKLCLLQGNQVNVEINFDNYVQELKSLNNEKYIIYVVCSLLVILLNIIFMPLLTVGILGLEYYIFNYINKLNKEFNNSQDIIRKLVQDIQNTNTSCNNFIYKRIKKHNDALHEIKDCTVEVLANELISHYIDNGVICKTSKEVMDCAIKILQYELQSDKDDLEVLLEDAKEKISEEALDDELVRFRGKDNK